MKYELAKQLKNAGFPKEGFELNKMWGATDNEHRNCPTLSELIEACVTNKEERCIYRIDYDWFEKQWEASAGTADKHFAGYGSTPEEAVANLWLNLNKI